MEKLRAHDRPVGTCVCPLVLCPQQRPSPLTLTTPHEWKDPAEMLTHDRPAGTMVCP
jgi:hypothetical protein